MILGPGEELVEEWKVVWFPPDVEERSKVFDSEKRARKFANRSDQAAQWNPLLVHVLSIRLEEIVPL